MLKSLLGGSLVIMEIKFKDDTLKSQLLFGNTLGHNYPKCHMESTQLIEAKRLRWFSVLVMLGATPTPPKSSLVASAITIPSVNISVWGYLEQEFYFS